ncbi:MAG: molybdopterin oxidoreductase [Coriobacteriia bacterium]|nr:MAG: molybdopterin oxidoreductase [Coriobacteriia bacterium]
MSAQCRTLTCIRCPRGCQVEVEAVGTEVVGVRGNSCKRGEAYARAEIAAPVRTVTSTVPVIGSATERMVSVKTSREVPKDKVMEFMAAILRARVHAPVRIGDVIVADVAGTGADVVATKSA